MNQAGMGAPQVGAGAYVPLWLWAQQQPAPAQAMPAQAAPAQAAPPPPPVNRPDLVIPAGNGRLARLLLLLVCALAGGLILVSALGVWPPIDAVQLGLSDWETFLLLAGGGYLLAGALYAAWRTRGLQDLDTAPWDARLAAYLGMAAGGLVVLAAAAAIVAIAVALVVASILLGLLLAALWTLLTRMDDIHRTEGNRVV
jgi:hypothetical protein